ncbi:MAG: tyrosine-protein phosphatase [Halioglobus sp.]
MLKNRLFWFLLGAIGIIFATIQFVPSPAVVPPATVDVAQREAHRLLKFEGIPNFRDLGGYKTTDGRQVKWGVLYRSGTLHGASRSDLKALEKLNLRTLVDFRSSMEKQEEPDTLPNPVPFDVVYIPTLDDGNKALAGEIKERVESGDFDGFDPNATMIDANRQFATQFVPQYRQFMETVQRGNGAPILWHCTAGKDRAGFASAIVLRLLGVPQDVVMQDYMASKEHALNARASQIRILRLLKGDEAADKLSILLGVEEAWLAAAFDEIDIQYGSFDNYAREALELTAADIEALRDALLEDSAA